MAFQFRMKERSEREHPFVVVPSPCPPALLFVMESLLPKAEEEPTPRWTDWMAGWLREVISAGLH